MKQNNGYVEIACIVDRSGSMQAIAGDAIGGYNQFLTDQKGVPAPARFTLVLFNHQYELVHDGVDLQTVPDLDAATYAIGGMTALLDAVGMTIDSVGNRIAGLPEAEQPVGVIVAVLTDGLENASREYTRQQVFDRIRERQAEGWEFVFLAANQDAVQEGSAIGIAAQDAQTYAHSGEGVREAWSGISGRTSRSRQKARKRGKPSSSSDDRSPIGFKAES